jgi:hypothetical protein
MPQLSSNPITTQPTIPGTRSRGWVIATNRKIAARIQYTELLMGLIGPPALALELRLDRPGLQESPKSPGLSALADKSATFALAANTCVSG